MFRKNWGYNFTVDKLQIVNEFLTKRKETLLKALEKAKEARNNAPGAMESHSDTTRSQSDKFVSALEQQLEELEETTQKINSAKKSFPLIEVSLSGEKKKFVLVPEGLGGEEVDGVRLLSKDSLLGLQLAGKNVGDRFDFNDQQIEILKIE